MARAMIVLTLLLAACAEETTAPPGVDSPTPGTTVASPEASPSPEPPAGGECVDATATGRPEVTIRLHDDEFVPACLTVLGGQGLKLTNHGSALHNFSVEGSDVSIDVPPGETVRTQAIGGAVPAGTHVFFCEYHRARGMEGAITVSEAG
jgi:plastocyanin